MEVKYCRGFRITVTSSLVGTRWHTAASLSRLNHPGPPVIIGPPVTWSAATEQEADEYALTMAKTWIVLESNDPMSGTPTRLAVAAEGSAREAAEQRQRDGASVWQRPRIARDRPWRVPPR
jgi:hypothetical protein